MNIVQASRLFHRRHLTVTFAALLVVASAIAGKPADPPKKAPSAPAKPAARPAAPVSHAASPGGAAHPGGATTAHPSGPTTAHPAGATTAHPGGATTAHPAGATTNHSMSPGGAHPAAAGARPGGRAEPAGRGFGNGRTPNGSHEVRARNGAEVRMRPGGRPANIRTAHGMEIHHGLAGGRRVEVMHGDRRIVAERGGRGFVERPYHYGGREYAHRTYYYNGRAYDRFYARGYYRGVYVNVYSPVAYYRPAFYGWAYNPWAVPIAFSFGFAVNPWYGYYGPYFAPYPVYPSASFWLTDYLVSQSLAAAYEARAQENAAAAQIAAADAMSRQTKDLIAAEVQRQIALENAEAAHSAQVDPASSGIQRMLGDNIQHVFITGASLDLVDTSGNECPVSQGDALQLVGPPPPDATAANLIVLSSKGGVECHRGATVSVAFADLQDMQNHMRETIDQGMGELQAKQAQGGLPALPASANAPPVKAGFAAAPDAPGPDPTAATEIAQQSTVADTEEKQTLADIPPPSAPTDAPAGPAPAAANPAVQTVTVALGQSEQEVTTNMGAPSRIVDLGPKKIYVYKDLKVTFKGGKVSDVQ
jgi:hypothetical protein